MDAAAAPSSAASIASAGCAVVVPRRPCGRAVAVGDRAASFGAGCGRRHLLPRPARHSGGVRQGAAPEETGARVARVVPSERSQATQATGQATGSAPAAAAVPAARRIQPPSWRDTRLLVGVGLVLASVVGGALVVAGADETAPVYAASPVLTPGATLGPDDVQVVSVRLDSAGDRYLAAGPGLQPGQVVLRTVAAGELVPRSAVGPRDRVDLRPVSVPVDADAAEPLVPGVLVDVWVADRDREGGSSSYAEPRKLAAAAQVSGRSTSRGALGSSTGSSVQLLLTDELVPRLIRAVDNESRVTLVPVPATLPGSGS